MPVQPAWDPLVVVVDYAVRGTADVTFVGQDQQGAEVLAGGTLPSQFRLEGRGRIAFPSSVALSTVGLATQGARVCVRAFSIAVLS